MVKSGSLIEYAVAVLEGWPKVLEEPKDSVRRSTEHPVDANWDALQQEYVAMQPGFLVVIGNQAQR